jgi:hypothetical protein
MFKLIQINDHNMKVKLSLCLITDYAIKEYGGVDV